MGNVEAGIFALSIDHVVQRSHQIFVISVGVTKSGYGIGFNVILPIIINRPLDIDVVSPFSYVINLYAFVVPLWNYLL